MPKNWNKDTHNKNIFVARLIHIQNLKISQRIKKI